MESIETTKSSLIGACTDIDNRIILLRGKWGTGKTYLWDSIKDNACFKIDDRPALYASLFGVRKVSELKLRLAQGLYLKDATTTQKLVKSIAASAGGWISKLTNTSVEDTAALWLPSLLKQRFIVLDDMERKHVSLDVDEIMGMLDEYSNSYQCRFLLLMNSEYLDDQKWISFYEKVIDAEVVLSPSAADSLSIAIPDKADSAYEIFANSVAVLNITNIRGIRRIWKLIKSVKAFANPGRPGFERWVPMMTLLVASHYRLVNGLPTYDFVKNYSYIGDRTDTGSGIQAPMEHAAWSTILERLGITQGDQFTNVIQRYLESGVLDASGMKSAFDDIASKTLREDGGNLLKKFYDSYFWSSQKSDSEIIEMARGLDSILLTLDVHQLAELVTAVSNLGDDGLAEEFVEKWFAFIESKSLQFDVEHELFYKKDGNLQIHASIKRKLEKYRASRVNRRTVFDAIDWVFSKPVRPSDEEILRSVTINDYVDLIRNADPDILRKMVEVNTSFMGSNVTRVALKFAGRTFMQACANIVKDDDSSRLSKILIREYKAKGLYGDLRSPDMIPKRYPLTVGERYAEEFGKDA